MVLIHPLKIKADKITSFFGMLRGFMFVFSKPKKAKLFVLPREMPVDIHMLFVFFPLIVIWLNKNKKVVDFSLAKPFIFYKIRKAKYVLEIPFNKKLLNKLNKGKKLSW